MVTPGSETGWIWGRDHVKPWWQFQHRGLDYQNQPFNDPVTQSRWQQLGFANQKFTGDMYDMPRDEPDFVIPFRKIYDLKHFSWSVYRMGPGTMLPEHQDIYRRFCELYDVDDINKIRRIVVMLEPWASGHYLEIDAHACTHWQAGDAFFWHGACPHIAANLGTQNRYTLQITGVVDTDIALSL